MWLSLFDYLLLEKCKLFGIVLYGLISCVVLYCLVLYCAGGIVLCDIVLFPVCTV